MSFSQYPEYKDSGVKWLDEVPRHWEVCHLKRLCDRITDGAHVSPETEGGTYPFVSTKDIDNDLIDFESCLRTSVSSFDHLVRSGCRPIPGDVLFSKDGTIGRTVVVREDRDFVVASSLIIIRPNADVLNPGYLHYLCQSRIVAGQVESFVKGAGLPRLSIQSLLKVIGVFPTLEEQSAIAAFLARETGKIDALVTEQKKLIDLLKEKRQAVISHPVTKGIDPKVPMKESGVEWLGEVPEHWNIGRVKGLASIITKGTTPTTIGAQFVSSGIRFLKAENISDGAVCTEPEFFIDEETHQTLCRSALFDRDVLVVIAGATTGKSAVLRANALPANTNQAVAFIRCKNALVAEYLNYWLSTTTIQQAIKLSAVQSAQPNLSMEDLGNLQILLPSVEEIPAIISFLESGLKKIDALVVEAQRAIRFLKERRIALISAAVTGKIDVRGLVEEVPASVELEPA